MAKIGEGQTRSLAGNDPKLRLNLKKIFDIDFSDKPGLKQLVTQAFIDTIRERTENKNASWTGSKFPKYTKEYIKSLPFRAAGKSPGDVNLRLTGAMMGTMDKTEETTNTVTLGWDDIDEGNKAHGHITGNVGKKRDFFALNQTEINRIKKQLGPDIQAAQDETTSFVAEAFREALVRRIRTIEDAEGIVDVG